MSSSHAIVVKIYESFISVYHRISGLFMLFLNFFQITVTLSTFGVTSFGKQLGIKSFGVSIVLKNFSLSCFFPSEATFIFIRLIKRVDNLASVWALSAAPL